MSDALDQLLAQLSDQASIGWSEETYDLALAGELTGDERAGYIARLIANARRGDTHAILTLGHLNATEALPVLHADADANKSWAATDRRAIVLLGHGAEVVDDIARDATGSPAKMARVAAVMDLAKIGGPVAIAALDRAIADVDYAVRGIAWDGLVGALDLERFIRNPATGKREKTTLLELLRDFLASDLAAFVTMGVDETRAITRAVGGGADPNALGLAWIPDPDPELSGRILAVIVDRDAAFPVDDIAKLAGVPRRWAEASIAMRLDDPSPDPRAPDALAHLFATWTIPVLEEVAAARATDDVLRTRIEIALATLRAAS